MKAIIDIPDDFIKDCDGNLDCVISLIGYEIDDVYSEEMGYTTFDKYTILPKGHGRLIDADELKSLSYEVLVDDGNPNRTDGLSACNGLVEDDIDLAPTIIEADTGEEE